MADPRVKQLKIKMGVLKRVAKERFMYEMEAQKERQRLEKMRAENRDEYDLRKQEEVINETLMMIPECHKRTYTAYHELKSLLLETQGDLAESEEFGLAKACLEEIPEPF